LIGFLFGSFIEVDSTTKNLLRGDVAWIKVVHVLGKRFVIRVLEDGRRVDEKGMCGVYRGLMALNNWFKTTVPAMMGKMTVALLWRWRKDSRRTVVNGHEL
jgi:hypothetical protein